MNLRNLSTGQLVLTCISIIISLALFSTSILNSLWIDTAAATITFIYHIVLVGQALYISRHPYPYSFKPTTNTPASVGIASCLAALWVFCFALTTDIAISGPSMGMGTPFLGLSFASFLRHVVFAQSMLCAAESAILVVIVVLALHESTMKTTTVNPEKHELPSLTYV